MTSKHYQQIQVARPHYTINARLTQFSNTENARIKKTEILLLTPKNKFKLVITANLSSDEAWPRTRISFREKYKL